METRPNNQIADRIERWANRWGYEVQTHWANTGTIYLTIDSYTIRVANHADAYATADYTRDGVEGCPNDCIVWLADKLGQPVPHQIEAAIIRANRKAQEKEDRENRQIAERLALRDKAIENFKQAIEHVTQMATSGDALAQDRLERWELANRNWGRKWGKKRTILRRQILSMGNNPTEKA